MENFWRRVICKKYGSEQGDWTTMEVRGLHGCSLWKGIRMGWNRFKVHTRVVAGDANRARF